MLATRRDTRSLKTQSSTQEIVANTLKRIVHAYNLVVVSANRTTIVVDVVIFANVVVPF